jgi:phosphoribosylformimino-5-aminoimidazole carboxamide ribotide isomerase
MEIWPAIDLRGGKCVRLQQGDYDRETVFGADPAEIARHWVEQGARRLHLVDLDGARDGQQANLASVQAILAAVEAPCQLGGGVRSESTIVQLLAAGLRRLVVGTRALKEQDWFRQMCRKFRNRLVLGIDARNGRVASHGWRQTSDMAAVDLAKELAGEPLAAIVYTDIATDGMMQGPNFAAIEEMRQAVQAPVIASGGVTTVEDVKRLAAAGVAGCIIGRALYEGTIDLGEAIKAAGEEQ